MVKSFTGNVLDYVAPFAGAWIEIEEEVTDLKKVDVAPFAGAWIEIGNFRKRGYESLCRTLRGCVD